MSLICPQCGAENRDSAKFCLKCAHQLVPLGAATEPAALEPRKRRRKRRPKDQEQPARTRQRVLWAVVLIAALIGMGFFMGRWGAQPAPPAVSASASAVSSWGHQYTGLRPL